jgi:3-hydroxyisobutyrate dehydrogenase
MTNYCPVPGPVPSSPANRDYKAGFTAAMMLKDLNLAQAAARATRATTCLVRAAAVYERSWRAAAATSISPASFAICKGRESRSSADQIRSSVNGELRR